MNAIIPFLDVKATYRELKPELDAAFARVMESGIFIRGPEVALFESEFARYCGASHAVGVGNGLDALSLSLKALGVGPGDEVIVPAHTFIATWLAVEAVGARVVPVDVRPGTGNIDPSLVEAAIGPRTRALIPVHLYGQPAEMPSLVAISGRHGIPIVEDAAQAHGAKLGGRPIGSFGRIAAFSFYPGKNLGAYGDGGAVVTSDPDLAECVSLLGNYGSRKKYVHEGLGQNSRLDELQAALLRVRLAVLDEWNRRRRGIALRYIDGLRDLNGLSLPEQTQGAEPAWHLFVVRHPRRGELQALLAEAGVATLVHYPFPPHLSHAYKGLGLNGGTFPIAEWLAQTVLSLPMGPHLCTTEVDRVVEAVRAAVEQLR